MLEVRPVESTDPELGHVTNLLKAAFPATGHMTTDYLDWCYRKNPAGRAVGRNAWDGARLAAHYVTVPLRARLLGEEVRGLLSLHTATHPDHQGRGLFTRLAEATYTDAREAGYDFVVGVANAASTPGFVGKLGFQLVRPLDVRIGFGASAPTKDTGDDAFERLWSDDELAWRLRCPARPYRRTAGAGGVTIHAPTDRFGIWVELASRPRAQAGRGSALHGLPPLGIRNPVRLWMGLDPTREWSGRPWMVLPERARPSPLNLIYRDLREPDRRLDPGRVRFSAIDFDAY